MATKPPNKHAVRTKETRELLLRSAETVFVRDGYEGAELGEIAALAGRTKGAIYAQFANKEDLFIALFEERTQQWGVRFSEVVDVSKDREHNIKEFKKFFLSIVPDHAWLLLLLEFKLYAARNPQSMKRLQSIYKSTYPADEKLYAKLFGKPKPGKGSLSRSTAIVMLLPILSALAVEENFAPMLLEESVLNKAVSRLFDALME